MALGVAEALDYLHNGNAQPVIHRDVKSSNILLSDDFEPQVKIVLVLSFFISLNPFVLIFTCTCFSSSLILDWRSGPQPPQHI